MERRAIVEEEKIESAPVEQADTSLESTNLTTEASNAMEQAENDLIQFVETQIKKMDNKLIFDGESNPPLEAISIELLKHPHVMLALTSMYETARWAHKAAKKSYDEWYAGAFLEVRTQVNDPKLSAAKWYTKEEIGMMVTRKYKAQKAALEADVELAEAKLSLLRRLIDGWDAYRWELSQLSKNAIAEGDSWKSSKYEGLEDGYTRGD